MEDFKVLVEIPAGSSIKYEVNEETGELEVDRFLHTAFSYPFNYGFIKGTKGEDNDPVDALVLSTYPVHPGISIKCHAIGMLEMSDEEGVDTKILAVPTKKIDPLFGSWEDISSVPEPTLNKIKHFFENYKTLEPGKWVKVNEFKDRAAAEASIAKSFVK